MTKHSHVKRSDIMKEKDRKTCQGCGDGHYMARHKANGKTRLYCGKCHMTIFE